MTLNYKLEDAGFTKSENRGSKYFLIAIAILFAGYFIRSNFLFKTKGIYTVCRVEYYEPGGSGSDLHISIFYHGQEFKTVANAMCNNCDGKLYFVEIVKDKPMGTVRFLEDHPVPSCIAIADIPKEGWRYIPDCK